MTSIFRAIKYLSQHSLQADDYQTGKNNVRYNNGFFRRQQLLYTLATGKKEYGNKRLFYEVAIHLLNLVNGDRERNLIRNADPELKDLTDNYLSDLALDIDQDIKRAYNDTRKRPYAYQYKGLDKN